MSKIDTDRRRFQTMRDMLRLALTDAGHTVVQAEDGRHGVEVLSAEPGVDVIITDINMPRMDGFGFIEQVRADERLRTVPILVLTTESEPAKKRAPARPAPPAGSSSRSIRRSWSPPCARGAGRVTAR